MIKRVLGWIISIPIALALEPCENTDLAARASAARTRGEFRVSATLYRKLAGGCPAVPEFRVNAGLMLHLAGDYEAALVEFRAALKANRGLFAAHLFAGLDSLKLGRHQEADSYLTSAYALNSADPAVNVALGQLHADLGEYVKANESYYRATRLDERNGDAWYGLAVTYTAIQREAIEAIAVYPDSQRYLTPIAQTDFERVQAERKDLQELLKAAPAMKNLETLANLAILAGGLARESLSRVIRLDPKSARVHLLIGNAHSELHNIVAAQEEFAEALRLDPGSFSAHLGLATMYAREGQHDRAVEELRIVLKARPQDPEACYLQARMLIDEQQYQEALPFLDSALAATPANLPHVHAQRGKAYAALGKTMEAIAEYKQALVADRKGMYHYQLYRVYLRAGDQENARAMLELTKALKQ